MDPGGVNLLDWYWEMPPVTRAYLTACTGVSVACALELITPFHLYFNWHAIKQGGQYWRLATNFMFFGNWGLDFLFHMYFLCNYCRKLEESAFAGRSLDFACCLAFGMACLMSLAPWLNLMFYGSSLSFMAVYLFARAHSGMQVALLGLIPFTAPYLPLVLMSFSALLGHDVSSDALGLAVGHAYFVLEDVYPALAAARGWKVRRVFPNYSNTVALLSIVRQALGDAALWVGQSLGLLGLLGVGAAAGGAGASGAGSGVGVQGDEPPLILEGLPARALQGLAAAAAAADRGIQQQAGEGGVAAPMPAVGASHGEGTGAAVGHGAEGQGMQGEGRGGTPRFAAGGAEPGPGRPGLGAAAGGGAMLPELAGGGGGVGQG